MLCTTQRWCKTRCHASEVMPNGLIDHWSGLFMIKISNVMKEGKWEKNKNET